MKPNIAVLGATGVVGREILSILEEKSLILIQLRCWHLHALLVQN